MMRQKGNDIGIDLIPIQGVNLTADQDLALALALVQGQRGQLQCFQKLCLTCDSFVVACCDFIERYLKPSYGVVQKI